MSEKPEYRPEKSENGVINNTEKDHEPEIETHEQNVSQKLTLKPPSRDSRIIQKFTWHGITQF